MSTTCRSTGAAGVVTGTLVIAGVVALAWVLLARRHAYPADPQTEIDRRIDSLEQSLSRLQNVFTQAVHD